MGASRRITHSAARRIDNTLTQHHADMSGLCGSCWGEQLPKRVAHTLEFNERTDWRQLLQNFEIAHRHIEEFGQSSVDAFDYSGYACSVSPHTGAASPLSGAALPPEVTA